MRSYPHPLSHGRQQRRVQIGVGCTRALRRLPHASSCSRGDRRSVPHIAADSRPQVLGSLAMTHDQDIQFSKSLTALLPYATAFARTLAGSTSDDSSLYEDFAQAAMLKAWEHRHQFVPGTNMKAWLYTILRNTIVSHRRHYWRERLTGQDQDQQAQDESANPERVVAARQLLRRIGLLKQEHQDVLQDMGLEGLTYSESAMRRQVPTGTIKSRVARARTILAQLTGSIELSGNRIMHECTGRYGLSPMTAP